MSTLFWKHHYYRSPVFIQLSCLSLGVVALWLWTSNRIDNKFLSFFSRLWNRYYTHRGENRIRSREDLLHILDDLAKASYQILIELSQMAAGIKRTLKNRGLEDAVAQNQIENMLLDQGFRQRLEDAEANILRTLNLNEDDIIDACQNYSNDIDILQMTSGISLMFSDAINGTAPLLPGIQLSEFLKSPDTVLKIIENIQKRKVEIFKEIFQTVDSSLLKPNTHSENLGPLPSAELNSKLTAGAQQAENEVLAQEANFIESSYHYSHAVSVHSRNQEFSLQKLVIDNLYSEKIVQAMQEGLQRLGKTVTTPSVVLLHDKLDHVKSEDLSTILSTADQRPVVCLVLEKTNNTEGMIALSSYSTALKAFDDKMTSCTNKLVPSFLFTTTEDFNTALRKSDLQFADPLENLKTPFYKLFVESKVLVSTHNVEEIIEHLENLMLPNNTIQTETIVSSSCPSESLIPTVTDTIELITTELVTAESTDSETHDSNQNSNDNSMNNHHLCESTYLFDITTPYLQRGSVRASHILIKHNESRNPMSRRTKQKITRTMNEAYDILNNISTEVNTENFLEFAKKYSDCSSYANGGDLGYFTQGQMQKPFENAAFNLKVGEISDIVSTDSGMHLIYRTG